MSVLRAANTKWIPGYPSIARPDVRCNLLQRFTCSLPASSMYNAYLENTCASVYTLVARGSIPLQTATGALAPHYSFRYCCTRNNYLAANRRGCELCPVDGCSGQMEPTAQPVTKVESNECPQGSIYALTGACVGEAGFRCTFVYVATPCQVQVVSSDVSLRGQGCRDRERP